jgi:hypothetical protein
VGVCALAWAQPALGACGSWQKVPLAATVRNGEYSDVSASSATLAADSARGAIDRWDGNSWTTVARAAAGAIGGLFAIAASAPTDAWVVGTNEWQTARAEQQIVEA